jgi:hypothetical protein
MKKNRPSNAYLSAVVAGLIAGSTLAAGAAQANVTSPDAAKTPAATQKDKNSCGGPNGCGSKKDGDKKAGPAESDKHACKGQNACKGKGGCKTDKNACKGQNACKGMGGCATDGKVHPKPTEKAG